MFEENDISKSCSWKPDPIVLMVMVAIRPVVVIYRSRRPWRQQVLKEVERKVFLRVLHVRQSQTGCCGWFGAGRPEEDFTAADAVKSRRKSMSFYTGHYGVSEKEETKTFPSKKFIVYNVAPAGARCRCAEPVGNDFIAPPAAAS